MRRKSGIIIMVLIMLLSIVGIRINEQVWADSPNAIRLEVNIAGIDKEEAAGKDRLFYGASPFGTGINGLNLQLKPGSKIAYDFYTPTPLAGMGGFEVQLQIKEWQKKLTPI